MAEKEKKMQNLEKKEGTNYIFKLAKKMKHENRDFINEICVRNKLVTTKEGQIFIFHWQCTFNILL